MGAVGAVDDRGAKLFGGLWKTILCILLIGYINDKSRCAFFVWGWGGELNGC